MPSHRQSLAQLTAEIVSAYVSNNKIAPSDLAALITTVAGQLAKIGAEVEPPAEEKPEPAVSVRRSIRPDQLVCLVCGKPQKMLKRHLAVQHGLTPESTASASGSSPTIRWRRPNYAQQRRELAYDRRGAAQEAGAPTAEERSPDPTP